jgi:hypothetical protein
MVAQEQCREVRGNFPFSTMAGARRLVGGMQTLIEALARRLKSGRLLLGHRLQSLEAHEKWIAAGIEAFDRHETISARAIFIALPPRFAIESVAFAPVLDECFVRVLTAASRLKARLELVECRDAVEPFPDISQADRRANAVANGQHVEPMRGRELD